ncbi:MAG: DUF1704 domain-containing protein [Lewinellaceae bacterium]|nr:DUF1704 domain-containing protein [Lewinellaceae bacterium]
MKKEIAYYRDQIIQDLGKGLSELIEDFSGEKVANEFAALLGQLNGLEVNFMRGIISYDDKSPHENRIREAVIHILDSLVDGQKAPREKPERINVPVYDFNDLVDRIDITQSIHDSWSTGRALTVLRGVRGIGKTSVALAYCHRPEYAAAFDKIAWVSVVDDLQTDLMVALNNTSLGFRFNEAGSRAENFKGFIKALQDEDGNNLLVIDGANDPKQILESRRQLESSNWKVLITSTSLPEDCRILEVEELKKEYAKDLFRKHYRKNIADEQILEEILEKIDYHTLLITLISRCGKKSPSLNIKKINEILDDKEALKKTDFQNRITIERLGRSGVFSVEEIRLFEFITAFYDFSLLNEDEIYCLTLFAVLPSKEIAFELILEILQRGGFDEIQAIDALNSLVEKGWLQSNDEDLDETAGVYYKCHQLIQIAAREKLSPNAAKCKPILDHFAGLLDDDLEEYGYEKIWAFPFFENIMDIIQDDSEELAVIHAGYGEILYKKGNRKEWKQYFKRAFEIRSRLYPENSVPMAQSYMEEGIVKYRLSEYADAQVWLDRSMQIFQSAGRSKSLVEANIWMARIYRSRGLNPDSVEKYFKTLEIIPEEQRDPLEIATLFDGLGMTYSKWGKLEESLNYRLKSLEIRKEHLPPNHPKIAIAYNNLGMVYNKMKNFEKARFYLEASIEIKKENFGDEFSELSTSYNNISRVYANLFRFEEALEAAEKGLKLKMASEDDNGHPVFAYSYDSLAGIYFRMKNLEKAKEYSDLALGIRKIKYAASNQDLQNSLRLDRLIDLCEADRAYRSFRKSYSLKEDITPVNLGEQKQLFFQAIDQGGAYNPVFQYEKRSFEQVLPVLDDLLGRFRSIDHPLSERYAKRVADEIDWIVSFQKRGDDFPSWLSALHGFPEAGELEYARGILDHPRNYVPPSEDLDALHAAEKVREKLEEEGHLGWEVTLAPMVAKISVNSVQKKIQLKPEARFSAEEIKRLLVHEIDSHVLRHENGNRQPFSIFATGFPDYLATEEGLAMLAEMRSGLFEPSNEIKYALRLVLSDLCREQSFFELYQYASRYVSPDAAFDMVVRIKRGLTDTAVAGGYTKDQVYLKGFLAVKDLPDETLSKLFIGKIGLGDLDLVEDTPYLYSNYPLPRWLDDALHSSHTA